MADRAGPQLGDPRAGRLRSGHQSAGMHAGHAQPAVEPRIARRRLAVAVISQDAHQVERLVGPIDQPLRAGLPQSAGRDVGLDRVAMSLGEFRDGQPVGNAPPAADHFDGVMPAGRLQHERTGRDRPR